MRQIIKVPRNSDENILADMINSQIYRNNTYEGYFVKEEVVDDEECCDITYLIFDNSISLN